MQTALKGVNSEVQNTQQQLKDVEKLLKLDPGNTELLAQKHRLLGETEAGTIQRDIVRSGVREISVSFSVTPTWLKKLTEYKQQ